MCGLLHHNDECGFRRVRYSIEGWTRCSIDVEVNCSSLLDSSVMMAFPGPVAITHSFLKERFFLDAA